MFYEFSPELLYFLLGGIMVGTISGLLPGIGNTIMMLAFFPFLMGQDPINIIVFYIALLSTGQYTGSVSSTVLAVPGEMSSLPAVKEGHRLFVEGKGALAISGAALGSWFGSMFCVLFVFLVMGYLSDAFFLYSTKFQAGVLVFVCLILIFTGSNRWYINLLLGGIGYILGMVGTHSVVEHMTWGTFGIPELTQGLPLFPILLATYVIPEIITSYKLQAHKIRPGNFQSSSVPLLTHFRTLFQNFFSVIRGSIIGFFAGLIPFLTTIIASNLSYSIEVWIQKRKKKYQVGNLPSLISAETANNAAALSSLLPLLLIGIPITSSEAVLSEILNISGHFFDPENFGELFYIVALCLVGINTIALLVAWPFVRFFNIFYLIKPKILYSGIGMPLIFLMWHVSSFTNNEIYYFLVLGGLLPLGYIFRKYNTIPLIFVFMMQNGLETNFFRLPYLIGF